MSIVCIGEILWDVFEDDRHIGGAAFNVAAHAHQCGEDVLFISAVGTDNLGTEALRNAGELGLETRCIRVTDKAPTGTVDIVLRNGQPDYRINRPAAYDFAELTEHHMEALRDRPPAAVYFGTLAQTSAVVRETTRRLIAAFPHAQRVYDVNLRRDSYDKDLVESLLTEATVVKLNEDEVGALGTFFGLPVGDIPDFVSAMSARFELETVCVTRGANGCVLWRQGTTATVPGVVTPLRDAVGAGDAFCAMMMRKLIHSSDSLHDIGMAANRLGAFVASRPGAIPQWSYPQVFSSSP